MEAQPPTHPLAILASRQGQVSFRLPKPDEVGNGSIVMIMHVEMLNPHVRGDGAIIRGQSVEVALLDHIDGLLVGGGAADWKRPEFTPAEDAKAITDRLLEDLAHVHDQEQGELRERIAELESELAATRTSKGNARESVMKAEGRADGFKQALDMALKRLDTRGVL